MSVKETKAYKEDKPPTRAASQSATRKAESLPTNMILMSVVVAEVAALGWILFMM